MSEVCPGCKSVWKKMRRVAAGLLWCVLVIRVGNPLHAQPVDPPAAPVPVVVTDYDFAWVYWFETQGRGYVREAVAQRTLPVDTPASRLWRGDAEAALVRLLDDGSDAVRASAVIALARMGYEPLLDRVLPSIAIDPPADGAEGDQAQRDKSQGDGADTGAAEQDETAPVPCLLLDASGDVRLAAWIALGLLDSERSRAALMAPPMQDAEEIDLSAQARAIGLLDELSEPHARWLVARLDDPLASDEIKRSCLWALSRHDDPALDRVFDAALANLPSTFAIGQVLLNRGYVQRRGGAVWLGDVLRYHPDVQGWAGYRALAVMPAEGYNGSTPRRLGMETRIAGALALAQMPEPKRTDDHRALLQILRRRMVAGNSAQAMDFNRGFDTIAYAMHCHGSEEDLDLLYDQLRGFAELTPDDPAVREKLEEGQVPKPEDLRTRQIDNEVRGYSAIAVGLLIRRATPGTVLHRQRPIEERRAIDIERLKRRFGVRLMRAIADPNEPASYRSACALALGLTGDERYAVELAVELGKLQAGDEAVLGYGLMALAMLGDDRAIEPARRYLTRPGKIEGSNDRLGRRAALCAVAIIGERGGQDTAEALSGAWGRDPWVSLGVGQASAWAGRYDALPEILKSTQSESANWRRAAAVALGEVFDLSHPSRLTPMMQGTNPTCSYRPNRDELPWVGRLPDAQPDNRQETAGWPTRRLEHLIDPSLSRLLWP